jgi:hypothetical protein
MTINIKKRIITTWLLLLLLTNGIVAFAYNVAIAKDATNLWALLATIYIYCLGLTQTGVTFSAIMRISRSEWGSQFSRLGEMLTLSFIPTSFILFLLIYFGGTEHLFYWARPQEAAHGGHVLPLSPWLGKGLFLWRTVILSALFYLVSFIYFRYSCIEKRDASDIKNPLNILAGFVILLYILTNTNTAWDFGMMIIPHWESSIFPVYFWMGNILGGTAFLFLMGIYFIPKTHRETYWSKEHLNSAGKLLLGFSLFWVYLLWSQHIVIWYGGLPNLTGPLFKQQKGSYAPTFIFMILTIFLVPFLSLIFRKIRLNLRAFSAVAFIICIGVLINRYLIVIPVFTDGKENVFATYTGVSLLVSGLAAVLLSFIAFRNLFPGLHVTNDR